MSVCLCACVWSVWCDFHILRGVGGRGGALGQGKGVRGYWVRIGALWGLAFGLISFRGGHLGKCAGVEVLPANLSGQELVSRFYLIASPIKGPPSLPKKKLEMCFYY